MKEKAPAEDPGKAAKRMCSWEGCEKSAIHAANGKNFCCEHYERIVNRLLAMLEQIREAVR